MILPSMFMATSNPHKPPKTIPWMACEQKMITLTWAGKIESHRPS